MKRKPFGPETTDQYPAALEKARAIAHKHGYAIGVHGSQTYDLDLIAAPWAEDYSSPWVLARAIEIELGWYLHKNIAKKPVGRRAFLIYGPNHAHIDLSVMPGVK